MAGKQVVAGTVEELIESCYTISLEKFLELYPNPILIGVGVVDVALLRPQARHRSTMPLGLAGMKKEGEEAHHLMGVLRPLESRTGLPWTRLALGRADDNDLIMDDPAVSEYHCYIKYKEMPEQDGSNRKPGHEQKKAIVIGDLGSTNGTQVNGQVVKPPMLVPLNDQDIITLGRVSFQFFTSTVLYQYLQLSPV